MLFSFRKKRRYSWDKQNIFLLPWRMFYFWNRGHPLFSAHLIFKTVVSAAIRSNFGQAQSRHFPCRNHTLTGLGYMWKYSLPHKKSKPECLNRCPKHDKFRYQCRLEIGTFIFDYLCLNNLQVFKISCILWLKNWVKVPSTSRENEKFPYFLLLFLRQEIPRQALDLFTCKLCFWEFPRGNSCERPIRVTSFSFLPNN